MATFKQGRVLKALRGILGEGNPSELGPLAGKRDNWEVEAPSAVSNVTRNETDEAPIPSDYLKRCSVDAFHQNVRYFMKKKGYPQDQAVAASFSALKAACGVETKAKMSPKAIVAKGKTKK
jgi:hypothetical protein